MSFLDCKQMVLYRVGAGSRVRQLSYEQDKSYEQNLRLWKSWYVFTDKSENTI